jgi:hypothetical protein
MKIPTDLQILEETFKRYHKDYLNFAREDKRRSSKIYVPIDCAAIARALGTDEDIVFGRYYYYLDPKHRYTQENKTEVHLFAFTVGNDHHAINFVLLTSLLAGMREEKRKDAWATSFSIAAILISVISAAISLMFGGS